MMLETRGMLSKMKEFDHRINSLTPNDPYRRRTAPLTSKRCILYIYSKKLSTEYFNLLAPKLFFFLILAHPVYKM